MVKYKQAIAVISNAPPVRLRYPPFARQTYPPLTARESRFRRGSDGDTAAPYLKAVSLQTHVTATAPPNVDWGQATQAIQPKRGSEPLRFEPEYDPDSLGENELPLFELFGYER